MRWLVVALVASCGGNHAPEPIASRGHATRADRMVAFAVGEDRGEGALTQTGFEVVRITRDDVVPIGTFPGQPIGWLDEHALVGLSYDDGAVIVSRYLDGRRDQDFKVTDADWPERDPDPTTSLFLESALTRSGEAWLSMCIVDHHACTGVRRYLRVYPEPRTRSKTAPPDIDADRAVDRWGSHRPWPRPPTVAAPAGITVGVGTVAVRIVDQSHDPLRVEQRSGVTCVAGGVKRTYPDFIEDGVGLDVAGVRWVSARPPVFEIEFDEVNYSSEHHPRLVYVRGCEPAFDGYAWLGAEMWASFRQDHHDKPFSMEQPSRRDGDWVFHAGERVIGKRHGFVELRANAFR